MSTFSPSKIRKAVEEFTPSRPNQFQELIAAKEVILELRKKRASYRAIADLLTRHCLPTSKTSVALFCHKVLGENVRPYGPSPQLPAAEAPVCSETASTALPPAEAVPPSICNESETPPSRPRGPRIAQIRLAKPQPQIK